MSKIYTKTGDEGETGLVGGSRISKSDPRIDLYGEIDELNSRIGYSHSLLSASEKFETINVFLQKIQSALFDLGSNLACEVDLRQQFKLPQVKKNLITELEGNIDSMESQLSPLKNFILPGGSHIASSLHLCRTCSRTCERKMVSYHYSTNEKLPDNGLVFMNRLSDYFFVLARYINKLEGIKEIAWNANI